MKNNHITRFSDSSLYDEICVLCGATDAYENILDKECPVARRNANKVEMDIFHEWCRARDHILGIKSRELQIADSLSCTLFCISIGRYVVGTSTIDAASEELRT